LTVQPEAAASGAYPKISGCRMVKAGCLLVAQPIHALREANVNNSPTSTFSASAIFSSPAMDGPFTPRSTKLMNSTE